MATEQRNKVLQLMADQGYITQEHADKLMASQLKVYKHPPKLNKSMADYFVDYVTRQLTKRYGSAMVFEGGLKVVTSIDLEWQQEAIDIIKSTTGPLDFGFKPSAALVAIDPANGYIRTMVGGLDYKKQKFNLAWQAKRQPGSSMKPFVLTAAVEKGMDPDSTYYSSKSPIIIPMGAFAEPWVVNGDGPGGPESVSAATTISDNVVFAQLSVDVGPEKTVDVAHRMGITSPLDAVPSITLGTSGVTPARDGRRLRHAGRQRHPPQAAGDRQGVLERRARLEAQDPASAPSPPGWPAWSRSASSARLAGHRLGDGGYFPYRAPARPGPPRTAGTCGTVGYTPDLAAAVWMGDAEKNSPMDGAYGGTYCAPMWAKFFAAALKDSEHPSFKDFPVDVQPVGGQDAGRVAVGVRVGVAVGQRQRVAEPRPDQDHQAEAAADQDDRTADAAADAHEDQAAPAHADHHGHTERPAEAGAGGRVRRVAGRQGDLAATDVTAAGTGSGGTGVAGAVAQWLAGLLGL